MATNRFRLKFMFWLDVTKQQEYELAETIDGLKEERKFSQTIRDGIRLICDLRRGRLDVLFELFPWIAAELSSINTKEIVVPADTAIKKQLDRLEQLILDTGGIPITSTQQPITHDVSGPKPMDVPQFDIPDFDDDDDLVLDIRKDTSNTATENFLKCMMSLQS